MKVHLDLSKDFGKKASLLFKEHISDSYPDAVKEELAIDLEALFKVFGGLAISVVEDAYPHSPILIEELMDYLLEFARNRVQDNPK
jgi:hypothetical protein